MSPKNKGKKRNSTKKLINVIPFRKKSGEDDNVHPWEDSHKKENGDDLNVHPWEDKKKAS